MQTANVCVETTENLELLNGHGQAQELRSILSSRLPAFYSSATGFWATQPTPKTRSRTPCSPPTNIWTSFKGGHRCLRG